MSDVTIKYKGQSIATMDATGSKTLQTQGKYCEGDIGVEYVKPAAPTGTKQISITQNGTTTEDVEAYANAEITVNVSGGGGVQIATGTFTGPNVNEVSFSVPFSPDLVYIYRSDIDNMTAIADMATAQTAIARDMFMFFNRTNANAVALISGPSTPASGTASTTRSAENYFTYNNGTLFYKCNQGNGAYFRNALQYTYVCMKWS